MSRNVEQSGIFSLIDRPLYDESFEYLKGLVDAGGILRLLRYESLEMFSALSRFNTSYLWLTGTNTVVTSPWSAFDLSKSIIIWLGEFSTASISPGHHAYFDFQDASTIRLTRYAPGVAMELRATYLVIQWRKGIKKVTHQVTELTPGETDKWITVPEFNRDKTFVFYAGQTNNLNGIIDSGGHPMLSVPSEFEVGIDRGMNAGNTKVSWYLVEFE